MPDDFSQATDLAASNPQKVKELQDLFWEEAEKYNIKPLLAGFSPFFGILPPLGTQTTTTYHGDVQNVAPGCVPRIYNHSYTISADLHIPDGGAEGVIVADANHLGGFSLFVQDGKLKHTYAFLGVFEYHQESEGELPTGDVNVQMSFVADEAKPATPGQVTLYVNGQPVGTGRLDHTGEHSGGRSVVFQKQTLKVVEVMAGVLRGRGCDVQLAAIEFTDPRYAGRFKEFPMPHPFRELVGMIPAESPRRRPAKIAIPGVVTERDYDLVCIGSPTWWLSTDVPVRSFLQSDTASQVLGGKPFAVAVCCRRYWKHNLKTVRRLGTERGGVFADGIHFRYQGGQVRSLLSLLSYLGSGEYRERYLGVKIPPTNLQEHHLEEARKFADGLANRLPASTGEPR